MFIVEVPLPCRKTILDRTGGNNEYRQYHGSGSDNFGGSRHRTRECAGRYPITQKIGTQEKLVDSEGAVIQGWTVTNLHPSSDVIPYQPHGRLWEATATDRAIRGTVTPLVADFNARAANGQTYPELGNVATAQGVNPGNIPQGQQTTGKLYFDVVGENPNGVVYNSGGRDLLVWTH